MRAVLSRSMGLEPRAVPAGRLQCGFPTARRRKAAGKYVVFADGFAGAIKSRVEPRTGRRDLRWGLMARCISLTTRTDVSGARHSREILRQGSSRHLHRRLLLRPPCRVSSRRKTFIPMLVRLAWRSRCLSRLATRLRRLFSASEFFVAKLTTGLARVAMGPMAREARWRRI